MAERFNSFADVGKHFGVEGKPRQGNQQGQNYPYNQRYDTKPKAKPLYMEKDCDYVKMAEDVIASLAREKVMNGKRESNALEGLTTSKIRKILTLVNEIYNEVLLLKDSQLQGGIVDKIRHMKVRLAYEAGREKAVKNFVEKAALIEGVDEIKEDKDKFIRFAKYLEALVAYHRYYGGKSE